MKKALSLTIFLFVFLIAACGFVFAADEWEPLKTVYFGQTLHDSYLYRGNLYINIEDLQY